MKTWRKKVAMVLTVVMMVCMLAGCSETSAGSANAKFKIGFVNLANTDVFCMSRETALTNILEGTDFSVSYSDGNNDCQKQLDQVNAFIAKGVDAIMVIPADAEAIVPAIKACNNQDIPVIVFGNPANDGDYIFVGSDNYASGYLQGEYMAQILPENAKVLYAAGTSGLDHAYLRRLAVHTALEDAGRTDVEFLDDQDCDYVKDTAMETCDAWIQKYSDGKGGVTFDAIICANDQMALGCVESLKGAGVLTTAGEIQVTGIDGTDDGLEAVKDGYMVQTVLQDAPGQAEAALGALEDIMNGGEVQDEYTVPYQSVTTENIDDYWPERKDLDY